MFEVHFDRPAHRSAGSALGRLRALLPSLADYRGLRGSWRQDALAGVTVGVVALPLALAFGVASGVGAAAGLVTAIVAGVLAAVFGGSSVQVSGPTGAMSVVLAPVVASVGLPGVALVTILAGIVLLVAGGARLGKFVRILPWPLIEGFTLGIAAIIFLQQMPPALGITETGTGNVALRAASALADATDLQWQALAVTLLVAALMLILPRLHRAAPASLIGVVAATALTVGLGWDVPVIGSIPSSLPSPELP